MNWALRYTFHAGYEPPDLRAQFLSTLGTSDPAAHVHFAAEQGVAGVLYPWALDRSREEVDSVREALAETGLTGSCVLSAPLALIFSPLWSDRSVAGRARLEEATRESCTMATSLKAKVLAALVMADADRLDASQQQDDVVANMRDMAAVAADHGLVIGIEPMLLPGLMLQSTGAAMDVIRRVDRPAVGMIYDTAHVANMEGALMPSFNEAFDHIVLLQIADLPGRVEPGAGTLELVPIAAEAVRRGYTGLVDLEHGWATFSKEGEAEGLVRLKDFDAKVHAAVSEKAGAAPRRSS